MSRVRSKYDIPRVRGQPRANLAILDVRIREQSVVTDVTNGIESRIYSAGATFSTS